MEIVQKHVSDVHITPLSKKNYVVQLNRFVLIKH